MDEEEVWQIDRGRYLEVLRASEANLEATVTQNYETLQRIRGMLAKAELAECDGFLMRYYETKDTVMCLAQPKPPMGFLGGRYERNLEGSVCARKAPARGDDEVPTGDD
jgi:hypothetical protein